MDRPNQDKERRVRRGKEKTVSEGEFAGELGRHREGDQAGHRVKGERAKPLTQTDQFVFSH